MGDPIGTITQITTLPYTSGFSQDPDGYLWNIGNGASGDHLIRIKLSDNTYTEQTSTYVLGFAGSFRGLQQPNQIPGTYIYLLTSGSLGSTWLYQINKSTMIATGVLWGTSTLPSLSQSYIFTNSGDGHDYFIGCSSSGKVVVIDLSLGLVGTNAVKGYAFFNGSTNLADSRYLTGSVRADESTNTVWAVASRDVDGTHNTAAIEAISFNPAGSTTLVGSDQAFDVVTHYTIKDWGTGYPLAGAHSSRFALDVAGHAIIALTSDGWLATSGSVSVPDTTHEAKLIRYDYLGNAITHTTVADFYAAWPENNLDEACNNLHPDGYLYLLEFTGTAFNPSVETQTTLQKISLTDLTVATTYDLSDVNTAIHSALDDVYSVTNIAIDHPGGAYGSSARAIFTANNTAASLDTLYINGLTTVPDLNGTHSFVRAAADLTALQVPMRITHVDVASAAETGTLSYLNNGLGATWYIPSLGKVFVIMLNDKGKSASPIFTKQLEAAAGGATSSRRCIIVNT